MKRSSVLILLGCALIGLSACSYIGVREKEIPLSGERKKVLENEVSTTVKRGSVKIAPAQDNKNWTQAGSNAQHYLAHPSFSNRLQLSWAADIGAGTNLRSRLIGQPLVVGNTVYVIDGRSQKLSALSLQTGQTFWTVDMSHAYEKKGYLGGGLAYNDGTLFVTTGLGWVFALRSKDGVQIWRKKIGFVLRSSPTYAQQKLFVQSVNNRLYALDPKTGKELWVDQGAGRSPNLFGTSSPAYANDQILVAYATGDLFSFIPSTGRFLWQESLTATTVSPDELTSLPAVRSLPVIRGNTMYLLGNDNQLVAFNVNTGLRDWEQAISGSETPWVSGNSIFAVDNDGTVYAVSTETGDILWSKELQKYRRKNNDASGQIHYYGPVLAGGRLYLLSDSKKGDSYVLDPSSGKIAKFFQLGKPAALAPIVAQGRMLILTQNGKLQSFQ